MPTKNPRYMVSVPKQIAEILCSYSKQQDISVSKLILHLIEEALELLEDMELSRIADEAWERNKDKPRFSHEEVWKRCNLQ